MRNWKATRREGALPPTGAHLPREAALAETGQSDWTIRTLHGAVEQDPKNPFPHRCLAQLYERAKKDPAKAKEHRRKAEELWAALTGKADDTAGSV